MVLNVESAQLEVYHPGNDTIEPDLVIPGPHIDSASVSKRVQKEMDKVKFDIHNDHAQYTGEIQHRDRLIFRTVLRANSPGLAGEGYGLSSYGLASYGGRSPPIVREWAGLIKGPIEVEYTNAYDSHLTFDATDFAFGILDDRIITKAAKETPAGEIVREIVDQVAPELNADGVEYNFDQTDYFANSRNGLKAVMDVADQADAILSGTGRTIHFRDPNQIEADFTLQWQDIGPPSVRYNDDDLVTRLRVDGGTAPETYDSQQVQTGYATITQDDPVIQQFKMPKNKVAEIELWTRPTGSNSNYVVRLQADDNGSPVNPSNNREDIAKKTLSHEFIGQDSFTTFLFPDHNAPGRTLWMIIQTEGDEQEIGVNDLGVPAYRAKYEYPIAIDKEGPTADQYRTIHRQRKRENLSTFAAANDFAEGALEHSKHPETVLEADVQSARLHAVDPGAVLFLDLEEVDAQGRFLVMERDDDYGGDAGALLSSTVKLQELSTV